MTIRTPEIAASMPTVVMVCAVLSRWRFFITSFSLPHASSTTAAVTARQSSTN